MFRHAYDRLSGQDSTFLLGETATTHMHVAGIQIFEIGDLKNEAGGVDFEAVKRKTEASLHRIPRYRQKLQWTPLFGNPVWVSDRNFNIDYHVRHTSLPLPGDEMQLKQLASRIMSLPLDRARPLWELWVVEGLQGGNFATITKIHHCVIDGNSGVDLAQILYSVQPESEISRPPRYIPRPPPKPATLLRDEFHRRLALPLRAARGWRAFQRETRDLRSEIQVRIKAVREMFGWAMLSPSESPVNGTVGPHRRFEWLDMSLGDVRAVRKAAGCSVNDVVLTTVTGALRSYISWRGIDPADLDFRISAPVSVRREHERGRLGNRVSSWVVRLPLELPEPLQQLERIHQITEELKDSRQALGVEMMMGIAEWTPPVLLSLGSRSVSGAINSIVTNVPGPQFPLYMLGARLLAMYPVVPLLEGMGLGIALFSYNGRICWGFNADFDLVPDLDEIPKAIQESFARFAGSVDVEIETQEREVVV